VAIMQSHLFLLVLFALFVSLVFAVIARDDAREQLKLGALMFAGFVASALVLGWLMYPFPI
jgi:prepilin signal peptidase PulO-like enzyme (type II secretory pathway)